MNIKLLNFLRDPFGEYSEFELIDFSIDEDGNVVNGTLVSKKGNYYPIINGIPRILQDELLISLAPVSDEWIKKYKPNLEKKFLESEAKNIQVDVAKSFETEWKKFSKIQDEFENIFNNYFYLWKEKNKFGSRVLDAGCGMGRWAYYAADRCDELFCVDISQAIDVAKNILSSKKNVYFVQADLLNLPFKNEMFDAVYSLGVLHHIPDTFGAMKEIASKIKKNGEFLVYFYYSLDNRPIHFKILLKIANFVRKILCKLPNSISHTIAFFIAIFVYYPFIYLGKFFKFLGFDNVAKQTPLYEGYKSANFYIIYNDSIDRFTTPLEKRFLKNEIIKMFKKLNFKNINVYNKLPYWIINGKKT